MEINIEKEINDKLSLRADLNYLASSNALTFDDIVEQGYVTYKLPVGNGVDLTFGKFNAPIGFELLDPVDMYQYSHALVFNYGLPTNLTGLMGSYSFNDIVDLTLYAVNGWDNNSDNNGGRTLGGRIGVTPMDGINLGVSTISGTTEEPGNTKDKKTVVDVDFTITMVEKLVIGGEFNSGKEEKASAVTTGDDAKWTGYLLMAHYDFTDRYGLTVRYDYFDDKDGARLGNSVGEKQQAYTIAPTFALGDGARIIAEYRRDKSNENVFNGGVDDSKESVAIEFTYSF